MTLDPEFSQKLLPLKREIAEHFNAGHWLEVGTITSSLDIVQNHDRLLRSLRFGDEDYDGCVLQVLIAIVQRDPDNLARVERYLEQTFADCAPNVSSVATSNRIIFSPSVFTIPASPLEPSLVAVMMPFSAEMNPVYEAIKKAATQQGLSCQRADNMWEDSTLIQDIFALIYRSFIVVCDFTGRNPNVFYECGIAHTLGKHVVPIAQHANDIPFDLQHHRYLPYLNNEEGREVLADRLSDRLGTLAWQQRPHPF